MLTGIIFIFTIIAGFFIILSFRTNDSKKRFIFIIPALGITYLSTFFDIIQGNAFLLEMISFIVFALIGFKRLVAMYSNFPSD